ncbi:MAG: type II toxin-antitoxin system HicA family toxin [Tannerella sp.]|nr:type II toxin-antitoxin system HicA family toxin [Tannerella sp.]
MKIWKVKEIIARIESDGWYFVAQKGSHRQFRHTIKTGTCYGSRKLERRYAAGYSKECINSGRACIIAATTG